MSQGQPVTLVEPCPGSFSTPGLGAMMGQQKPSGVYYGRAMSRVFVHSWSWGRDGSAETIRCVLWWSRVPGPAPLLDEEPCWGTRNNLLFTTVEPCPGSSSTHGLGAMMGQQKSSGLYYGGAVSLVLLHSWSWGRYGAAETIRCVLWWSPVPGPPPLVNMAP